MELFIPIAHAVRHNPAVIREIFWQNGSLLYGSDTAKQEFFMRLQLRLQSLHKHDFISNQLLFYCWLTQQHFNFSVSFSFKGSMTRLICKHSGRHFLETGPDQNAMVITVELFNLKPRETIQFCTAWLLTHDYVTGGVCLAGLVMDE